MVLTAGMMLAAAPLHAATAAPQTAYDLHFDGYCDGLHLNIPSVGLPGTAYSVDGDQTGCASAGVFGVAKPNNAGIYGITKGAEFITIPNYGTHTVINKDHTWVHYGLNGNLIYVLNSGTWTTGPPARGGAGVSSFTPRAGASRVGPASVTSAKEIHFDGYCDGMHLVSPSAGLGIRKTVDGNRTGCASDGLMGTKTKINNLRGSYAVSFFANGSQWLETAIFSDHTWVHYAVSGDVIYVLNSGTWSPGPPPIGAPAKSSTS